MFSIIFFTIVFSVSGAATTVLLGDRNLLSGNLLNWNKFLSVIFHWRFIVAFLCAFVARYSFMLLNAQLLKIPSLAQNSTTIAGFITSVGVIFVILANYLFLGERISFQQVIGAVIIIIGVFIVLR